MSDQAYLRGPPAWISVADRLPAADATVLVVINTGPGYVAEPFVSIAFFDADKKAFQEDGEALWIDGVTHWMLLPALPA